MKYYYVMHFIPKREFPDLFVQSHPDFSMLQWKINQNKAELESKK